MLCGGGCCGSQAGRPCCRRQWQLFVIAALLAAAATLLPFGAAPATQLLSRQHRFQGQQLLPQDGRLGQGLGAGTGCRRCCMGVAAVQEESNAVQPQLLGQQAIGSRLLKGLLGALAQPLGRLPPLPALLTALAALLRRIQGCRLLLQEGKQQACHLRCAHCRQTLLVHAHSRPHSSCMAGGRRIGSQAQRVPPCPQVPGFGAAAKVGGHAVVDRLLWTAGGVGGGMRRMAGSFRLYTGC